MTTLTQGTIDFTVPPDLRDLPIARWYADARAARIYDGASEVHRMTIARELLKLAMQGESTKAACGDLA